MYLVSILWFLSWIAVVVVALFLVKFLIVRYEKDLEL